MQPKSTKLSWFSFTDVPSLIKTVDVSIKELDNFIENLDMKTSPEWKNQFLQLNKLLISEHNVQSIKVISSTIFDSINAKDCPMTDKQKTEAKSIIENLSKAKLREGRFSRHQKKWHFYIWTGLLLGALILSAPFGGAFAASGATTIFLVAVVVLSTVDLLKNLASYKDARSYLSNLKQSMGIQDTSSQNLTQLLLKKHGQLEDQDSQEIIKLQRGKNILKQRKHLNTSIKLEILASFLALGIAVLPVVAPEVFGIAALITGIGLIALVGGYALVERRKLSMEGDRHAASCLVEVNAIKEHTQLEEHDLENLKTLENNLVSGLDQSKEEQPVKNLDKVLSKQPQVKPTTVIEGTADDSKDTVNDIEENTAVDNASSQDPQEDNEGEGDPESKTDEGDGDSGSEEDIQEDNEGEGNPESKEGEVDSDSGSEEDNEGEGGSESKEDEGDSDSGSEEEDTLSPSP